MAGTAVSEKVTFTLPKEIMRQIRHVVAEGVSRSQNSFVRQAIEKELRLARDEMLRREFEEAARDPLFMQDIEETMAAFAHVDAETARMIPDG